MKLADRLDKTIAHECGHAVGLLLQDHGVAEVRVDHELVGVLGRVTVDFSNSSADYGYLIACFMGPMNAGDPPPPWPPDPNSNNTDERNAAILVEYLGLDETAYKFAIAIAATWLDWHAVKGTCALLGEALHRVPVITGEQLRELLGPHLARPQPEEAVDAA